MREWKLALSVVASDNPEHKNPRFLQIARALTESVRQGRLRPGDSLPGSRVLAESLGVHRNTVLAAYRELIAEGWITTEPARGTFVSLALPEMSARSFAAAATPRAEVPIRVGYDLPALPTPEQSLVVPRGALSLMGGIPDVRLAPIAPLARAYRRALKASGRTLLAYGDAAGCEELRVQLAQMLSATRGLAVGVKNVVVTRGSQMALDLVARTLLSPGDVVAVESLGYRPAWEAFRAAGAKIVPLPVDEEGVDVAALETLAASGSVRAVYVTPHHQYPTTVALSPGRRLLLLELARKRRIAIIEDDYDHEFHYDGRPVLPLASADDAGMVVYIGTLSKVLAPGLRIGYIIAPRPVIERVVALRRYTDRQGDLVLERAIAELLEDGELSRHVRRARRTYLERRDVLVELLQRTFGDRLAFEPPAGGTALWARAAPDIAVDAWAARALDRGVVFQTARYFAFDGRARPFVRLGFAQLEPTELREAVKRMASALKK